MGKDAADGDGGSEEEKKCGEGRGGSNERKWVDLLGKAERRAKVGWGCDAWVDLSNSRADEACDNESSETNKRGVFGSSVLARAKRTPSSTKDAVVNVSSSEGASTSSLSGG